MHIQIVGRGQSIRFLRPRPAGMKCWTINLTQFVQPWDEAFWLDHLVYTGEVLSPFQVQLIEKNATAAGKKVYSINPPKMFSHFAKPFPHEEILQKFPGEWFNNSLAWMLAFAYLQGAHVIWLDGVDFTAENERASEQHACVAYWIAFLRSENVTVSINRQSMLLDTRARAAEGYEPYGINPWKWGK